MCKVNGVVKKKRKFNHVNRCLFFRDYGHATSAGETEFLR